MITFHRFLEPLTVETERHVVARIIVFTASIDVNDIHLAHACGYKPTSLACLIYLGCHPESLIHIQCQFVLFDVVFRSAMSSMTSSSVIAVTDNSLYTSIWDEVDMVVTSHPNQALRLISTN